MTEDKEILFIHLQSLAQSLGLDLQLSSVSVATDERVGRVRTANNSLEATLFVNGMIEIESPRTGIGIEVQLVDYSNELQAALAPKGALYRIRFYRPEEKSKEMMGGVLYVGPNGPLWKTIPSLVKDV